MLKFTGRREISVHAIVSVAYIQNQVKLRNQNKYRFCRDIVAYFWQARKLQKIYNARNKECMWDELRSDWSKTKTKKALLGKAYGKTEQAPK